MKTSVLVAGLLVASLGARAESQDVAPTTRLTVRAERKLWLEGRSNVNRWSCVSTVFDAVIEVDSAAVAGGPIDESGAVRQLRRVEVKVPVRSLDCGNGGLTRDLHKALKVGTAPEFDHIIADFTATSGSDRTDALTTASGTLIVAGRDNCVTLDVRTERRADGSLKISGELPVLMTDYGIKPPTAMLGLIRANNMVTVKFELIAGVSVVGLPLGR